MGSVQFHVGSSFQILSGCQLDKIITEREEYSRRSVGYRDGQWGIIVVDTGNYSGWWIFIEVSWVSSQLPNIQQPIWVLIHKGGTVINPSPFAKISLSSTVGANKVKFIAFRIVSVQI